MKIFAFGLILVAQTAMGQLKELQPATVTPLALSADGEKAFNEAVALFQKIDDKLAAGTKYDDLTPAEKKRTRSR